MSNDSHSESSFILENNKKKTTNTFIQNNNENICDTPQTDFVYKTLCDDNYLTQKFSNNFDKMEEIEDSIKEINNILINKKSNFDLINNIKNNKLKIFIQKNIDIIEEINFNNLGDKQKKIILENPELLDNKQKKLILDKLNLENNQLDETLKNLDDNQKNLIIQKLNTEKIIINKLNT